MNSATVTLSGQLTGEHFQLPKPDPDYGNKTIIPRIKVDGNPLSKGKGPFRLIVPDDKALARSNYEVVELIVGFAKD